MTTEQYQMGYEAGYPDGFDAGISHKAQVPLTDEQIKALIHQIPSDSELHAAKYKFARLVERAHGIGGQPT